MTDDPTLARRTWNFGRIVVIVVCVLLFLMCALAIGTEYTLILLQRQVPEVIASRSAAAWGFLTGSAWGLVVLFMKGDIA